MRLSPSPRRAHQRRHHLAWPGYFGERGVRSAHMLGWVVVGWASTTLPDVGLLSLFAHLCKQGIDAASIACN